MIVDIQNLKKKFGSHEVLQNINLTIEKGNIIGLLGPNGAGKSTLIKCINDLFTPDEGTILIDGKPSTPTARLSISYLPEKTYLDPNWTIEKALHFFLSFYSDFDSLKAQTLLKEMNLDPNLEIKSLSKGMQEKLQLVLVMSRKAKLYILDEPLSGVDPASREVILDTILSNFGDDSSILISTHLISDVERILDKAIFMKDGNIILYEEADEIRAKNGHSLNEQFKEVFK